MDPEAGDVTGADDVVEVGVEAGVWRLVCGLWCVEAGVEAGVWRLVCGGWWWRLEKRQRLCVCVVIYPTALVFLFIWPGSSPTAAPKRCVCVYVLY